MRAGDKIVKLISGKDASFRPRRDSDAELLREAVATASRADVIVAALGEASEMSGECSSRSEISIPAVQVELLKDGVPADTTITQADADAFIDRLPNKFDTPLMRYFSDNGIELSIGQWQKLSIARAFYSDSDFLILDEHTAALDPKTAETIMILTDRIVREKNLTALMVTHNLRYAVEYGSRLVMMHEGKAIIDIKGEKKKKTTVDDLLGTFYSISVERGN